MFVPVERVDRSGSRRYPSEAGGGIEREGISPMCHRANATAFLTTETDTRPRTQTSRRSRAKRGSGHWSDDPEQRGILDGCVDGRPYLAGRSLPIRW